MPSHRPRHDSQSYGLQLAFNGSQILDSRRLGETHFSISADETRAHLNSALFQTTATTAIQNNVSVFPVASSATGSLTGSMSLGSSFRTLFTARLTG